MGVNVLVYRCRHCAWRSTGNRLYIEEQARIHRLFPGHKPYLEKPEKPKREREKDMPADAVPILA